MIKGINILNNKLYYNFPFEFIALILFPAATAFIYYQRYYSYLCLALAANIGLILFIVFNKYFPNKDLLEPNNNLLNEKPLSANRILSIVYTLAYGLSLLTLLSGFYTKTIWYYFFISICSGSIAAEILFFETKLIYKTNLFKSVLLFLNLSLSNQILYPFGIGNPDNYSHIYAMAHPIIETGRIPLGLTYTFFPLHQMLAAITSTILDIPISVTYHCLGAILMSLGPIFAFSIGKKVFDERFGLLSALFYCCSDYLIYWGSHPVQLAYMYPQVLLFFLCIISIFKKSSVQFILLFFILCINMIFLHHYSAVIMIFVFSIFLLIDLIKKAENKKYKLIATDLIGMYIVLLISQWIYYSNIFGRFVNMMDVYINAFTVDVGTNVVSQTYYDKLPLNNIILNEIGSSILLIFSVIGFFYVLKNRSFFGGIISGLFTLFLILIGIGAVINVMFLLPNRLYAFMQELSMIFLATISITWLLNNYKRPMKIGIVIMFILLQFFSASSTIAGFETSPFLQNQPYWKFYETTYERDSAIWMENYANVNNTIFLNSINIDPEFSSMLDSSKKCTLKIIDGKIVIDTKNIEKSSYIVFNDFNVQFGFIYENAMKSAHMGSRAKIKLDPIARDILTNNDYAQIYNNGILTIYEV